MQLATPGWLSERTFIVMCEEAGGASERSRLAGEDRLATRDEEHYVNGNDADGPNRGENPHQFHQIGMCIIFIIKAHHGQVAAKKPAAYLRRVVELTG